jgi:hypothetical protein
MTTIAATVIADSVSDAGKRITTLQLRYPRFIHAELMTHRAFSRNASSSRAIPVERLIQDVKDDPAVPLFWGRNQKGMQAKEEHNAPVVPSLQLNGMIGRTAVPKSREQAWLLARDQAVEIARAYAAAGYHKQVVNRLLEPFAHINVVVTATEWSNFFALRCHEAAEPHMQMLGMRMREAMALSKPEALPAGGWHLPYIREEDEEPIWALVAPGGIGPRELAEAVGVLKLVSAARCARVSYLTHDGRPTSIKEDLALAQERLLPERHMSPFEHQAMACAFPDTPSRNFLGWEQHRARIELEAAA